jgi:UDP-N-acetylmuramoylalanine--D-glutamate ligase
MYIVYGLGISGISAIKFLLAKNEKVIATADDQASISKSAEQLKKEKIRSENLQFLAPDEIKFDKNSIIIFSPGIPLYAPKKHKILDIVAKTKAKLICDLEEFYLRNSKPSKTKQSIADARIHFVRSDSNKTKFNPWLNLNCFIGITGTNGKSTTTALTGFVFKQLKISSEIGGNIGIPCFELPQDQKNFSYIFETSSYQLDLLQETHFHIASLLNITPDHLDRHGSMAGYIKAKKRIFQNQTADDFALIDADNENSKKVLSDLKKDKKFAAKLVPISTKKIPKEGIALINSKIIINLNGSKEEFPVNSKFLLGEHNAQNIAFAFANAYFYLKSHQLLEKNSPKKIISAIEKFEGLPHRMQILGQIGNIKFINDSKATNVESTRQALAACDNIFWILGGKPKGDNLEDLKPFFGKIIKAYLIGEATEIFAKILQKNSVEFVKCGTLEKAFLQGFSDAKKSRLSEKCFLLSPACASFDQWQNFEQRGEYFRQLFIQHSQV